MRRSIDPNRVEPTRAFVARMYTVSDYGWSMTSLIVAGADQGFERYEVVKTVEKLCGEGFLEMGIDDLYYRQNGWPACERGLLSSKQADDAHVWRQRAEKAEGAVAKLKKIGELLPRLEAEAVANVAEFDQLVRRLVSSRKREEKYCEVLKLVLRCFPGVTDSDVSRRIAEFDHEARIEVEAALSPREV